MSDARLHRPRRDPERLDSLDLYVKLKERTEGSFVSDGDLEAVQERFSEGVRRATKEASTVHGWRAQNLFKGVVVSLDRVQFIKEEDRGDYLFAGADIKPPDFRIRTERGVPLFVEVKNTRPRRPLDGFSISAGEVDACQRYAELAGGGRVLLAIYWVWWNLWTLVDLRRFQHKSGRIQIDLPSAAKANEMALLGDQILATEFPLALTLHADRDEPHAIQADGSFPFTIGRVEYSVANRQIASDGEKRIAHTLMLFGGWQDERQILEKSEGQALAIRFEVWPEEPPPSEQPFAMHNPLSSLFSAFFNMRTLDSDGSVAEVDTTYDVGGFGSLVEEPYEGEVLSIWRFTLNVDDLEAQREGSEDE